MKKLIYISLHLFILIFLIMPSLADAQQAIRTSRGRFVDESGREVILRGVNTGGRSKMPPFYPFDARPDFNTALNRYADDVASLGFNVVRLLVIYEAAEPERGKYDEEYLRKYDRMVRAFAERGIKIIIDSHQDLFSRRLCGDGFPDWVLDEKYRDRVYKECRNWSFHYFTQPVLNSFDRLYLNKDGVRDSYAAFFKMLSERYKDEPAVIGFEPMNEPMPGASGMINFSGWYKDLFALYEAVGEAVHQVDRRYLIFADICPLENTTGAWNTSRARPKIDNLVLSPHYYDTGTFGISLGQPLNVWLKYHGLGRDLKLARSWDVPVLITEFGVSPVLADKARKYIDTLYPVFDELHLSGTFWEASMSEKIWNHENTSLFEADGAVRPASYNLDRPYPRAVAGSIKIFSFEPESGRFEMIWQENVKISGPTEIYLPPRIYNSSPKVQLDGENNFTYDAKTGLLVLPSSRDAERKIIVTP